MVKFHLEFRQLWCQLDISRSRKYFMKFEVSILVILAVRFGIPHVFVFSKSVYLTCLSLIPLFFYGSIYFQKRSHFLFSYVFAIISPLHGNVQPGQRFWVRLRVSSEPNDVRRRCEWNYFPSQASYCFVTPPWNTKKKSQQIKKTAGYACKLGNV